MEKRLKILIIDDEKTTGNLLVDLLQTRGFETLLASSGKEGLARLETFTPDLITLDLNMPQMDGFEVLKHLKKNEKTRNIPVIIVSVMGSKKQVKKVLSLGAEKYLTKPFSIDRFYKTIGSYAAVS